MKMNTTLAMSSKDLNQVPQSVLVPTVIESTATGERAYDLLSRLMKDRIIILGTAIDDAVANVVVGQLLFLESQDPDKDIYLYINSPGGSITAGMAIYDTMNFIKPKVHTICIGMAASMGAFLLSAGEPGHRYCLPNAEVMIHQPLGGAQGQSTEIEIAAKRIIGMRNKLERIMAESTNGKTTVEEMNKACERDNFLEPEEALKIGLIDQIISKPPTK